MAIQLKLTLTNKKVSYNTSWTSFSSSYARSFLYIETTPPGNEDSVVLQITDVQPISPATTKLGDGTLTKICSNAWKYEACNEPTINKNPPWLVRVTIGANRNGNMLATKVICVYNVFEYFSQEICPHYNRNVAWQYAKWKYSIDISSLKSVDYKKDQDTPGSTNIFTKKCTLGSEAYRDVDLKNENACASTLGHENVHGTQSWRALCDASAQFRWWLWSGGYPSGNLGGPDYCEVAAYTLEINNCNDTGISDSWKNEAIAWRNYFNCTGPMP